MRQQVDASSADFHASRLRTHTADLAHAKNARYERSLQRFGSSLPFFTQVGKGFCHF